MANNHDDWQETEMLERPSTPRQEFPAGYDPATGTYAQGYGPAPQYVEYEQPREPARRGSRVLMVLLGALCGIAVLAAVAFFGLWRASESKPLPPPVTQTVTETATVTTSVQPAPEPALPSELPQLPSELPDLPEIDVEGWLNGLLEEFSGQPQA